MVVFHQSTGGDMSTSRLDEIRNKLRASIRDATNQAIDDMSPESKRPSSTPDVPLPHSFCPKCGQSFTAPAKFCTGCGTDLAGSASASMPSARSVPAGSAVARQSSPLDGMQSSVARTPAADIPSLPLRPGCKALCIGMGNYEDGRLTWPRKDAEDLSEVLNGLGYQVTSLVDRNFKDAIQQLWSFIQGIEPDDDIVFTYSGHGCGQNAVPYLTALDSQSLATMINVYKMFIEPTKARQAKSVVVVIDSCRGHYKIPIPWEGPAETEPVSAKTLGARRPEDEFGFAIIYGSSHDMSSQDSPTSPGIQNGLFTYFFKSEIARPGQSLTEAFRRVQKSVMDLSLSLESVTHLHKYPYVFQKPSLTYELVGDYFFNPVR
jgi:hypothetical protein